MPLEDLTGIKFVGHLVPTNPDGGDDISQGDDHIRGVKNVIQQQLGTATDGTTTLPGDLILPGTVSPAGGYVGIPSGNRNVVMNGACRIAQRGISFPDMANGTWLADRFFWSDTGSAVLQGSVGIDVTGSINDEFTHAIQIVVTTPDVTTEAGDQYYIGTRLEAFDTDRFGLGTGGAKTATLSFWHYADTGGTFCVSFQNDAQDRSYVSEFTVGTPSVWEKHTINLTMDAAGTWLHGSSSVGLRLQFGYGSGVTFKTANADTWEAGNFTQTDGSSNFTVGTFTARITGIQLELGTVATQYDHRPISEELERCQRFFKRYELVTGGWPYPFGVGRADSTTQMRFYIPFNPEMRRTPTIQTTGVAADYGLNHGPNTITACTVLPFIDTVTSQGTRLRFTIGAALLTLDEGGSGLSGAGGNSHISFFAEL